MIILSRGLGMFPCSVEVGLASIKKPFIRDPRVVIVIMRIAVGWCPVDKIVLPSGKSVGNCPQTRTTRYCYVWGQQRHTLLRYSVCWGDNRDQIFWNKLS